MPDQGKDEKQAPGTGSADRRMGFDCCGFRMDDATTRCSCGSVMRRHPFVTSAILAFMGLAALVIPAGAVMGIIAFFRTI